MQVDLGGGGLTTFQSSSDTADAYWIEVGVVHGLLGSEAGLMIVAQELIQKVNGLWHCQVLVLIVDEL